MNQPNDRVNRIIEELLGERPVPRGRAWRDLKNLWTRQLAPHHLLILAAGILTVVWSLIQFAFPVTWKFLIDKVLLGGRPVPTGSQGHLVKLCLLFFAINMGLWTFRLSCHWLRRRLIMGAGQGMVYELRRDLHRKLQALHIGFFEKTPVGVIMARVLDDVNMLYRLLTRDGPNVVSGLCQLITGCVLLLYYRWQLALIVICVLPIHALAYLRFRPLIRAANRALRRLNAKMYARSTERIGGIRVVKAFAREQAEVRSFARLAHDSIRVAMRLVKHNQSLSFISGLTTALTRGLIIYVGARMIAADAALAEAGVPSAMTIGTLMLFVGAMQMLFRAVHGLTMLGTMLQAGLVVLRRVLAVLEEPEEVPPGKICLDGMAGKIVFDRVSFTYPGQVTPALDDVSFRVEPGEKVAIMGPSGSGKTTVFKLLLRFYDPQRGNIRVGGVNLVDADPASLRAHIRMVQQEPTVFAGSIADNIAYGKLEASREEIELAARRAELHDFVMSLPLGYDTEVGENGIDLSGGQKQRLSLATAILTDPEVLLLDDTTSGLDAATEVLIRKTLNEVLAGRTSLIITQRVATARECDRIVVLENGRVVQEGTHEQLRRQEGFYRDVCLEQEEWTDGLPGGGSAASRDRS